MRGTLAHMKTLIQRYLAANFIVPLLASCVFFVFFLLTFQLFRVTQLVISKDVPVAEILSLISNMAISFIPMAIPLSILFSLLFSIGKMSEDSEIVAARSFGYSRHRLFLPYFIVAIIVAFFTMALNTKLIPESRKVVKNTMVKLTSKGVLSNIKPEQFFTEIPGVTLFAGKVENEGRVLGNVFINFSSKEGQQEQVIFAERGVLVKSGQETNLNMRLHLFNGNIVKTKADSGTVEKILFKEYDFPIFKAEQQNNTVNRDSMWSSGELWNAIKQLKEKLVGWEQTKASRELAPSEEDSMKKDKLDFASMLLEFWNRINNSVQILAFTLLGFSIGVRGGRGKARNTGGIALICLILYYAVLFFGIGLAKKGKFDPMMANLLPTILLFIVGGFYYRKFDWSS